MSYYYVVMLVLTLIFLVCIFPNYSFVFYLLLTCFFVRLLTFMGEHVCLKIVIKDKVVMNGTDIIIIYCSKEFTYVIEISRQ